MDHQVLKLNLFNRALVLPILALCLIAFACKKEDKDGEETVEAEIVTSVKLTFTPKDGGDAVEFSYTDLSADGISEPIIVNDTLSKNTSYSLNIALLNELESPVADVTGAINELGTDYQIFFLSSNSLNMTINYSGNDSDNDSNGNPIGLVNDVITTDAATGNLTVILRHKPNKEADDVSSGFIENAEGTTIIQARFFVTVE